MKSDQHQDCGPATETVDAYIAKQPENIRPLLKEIRDTLRAALPGSEERISWGMPTFWRKHNIIHFASLKNHIGIYPGDKAMEKFAGHLKQYKTSKGALQLPYNRPLPLELIAEIAKWCAETVNHY